MEEIGPLGFRENRRNWRKAGEVQAPLTKGVQVLAYERTG